MSTAQVDTLYYDKVFRAYKPFIIEDNIEKKS